MRRALGPALALAALSLVACSDVLSFEPLAGPPGSVDATAMTLGTAAYFDITDIHPEVEGSTEYAFDSVTTDDPSILSVIPDHGGFIFVAAGVGTTTLHLVSNQRWDLPVAVVAPP